MSHEQMHELMHHDVFKTVRRFISAGAILGHITPRKRGAAAEEN